MTGTPGSKGTRTQTRCQILKSASQIFSKLNSLVSPISADSSGSQASSADYLPLSKCSLSSSDQSYSSLSSGLSISPGWSSDNDSVAVPEYEDKHGWIGVIQSLEETLFVASGDSGALVYAVENGINVPLGIHIRWFESEPGHSFFLSLETFIHEARANGYNLSFPSWSSTSSSPINPPFTNTLSSVDVPSDVGSISSASSSIDSSSGAFSPLTMTANFLTITASGSIDAVIDMKASSSTLAEGFSSTRAEIARVNENIRNYTHYLPLSFTLLSFAAVIYERKKCV